MRKIFIEGGLIIPILLGVFSIAGLCVVLLFGRLNNSREIVQAGATETPFRYIYMGTEPNILEPTLEETETTVTEAPTEAAIETAAASETPRPVRPTPTIVTSNPTNTVTGIVLATDTSARTRTPTPAYTTTPGVSVYDDTDFRLVYSGNWVGRNDIPGAYQNTLHVSDSVGDSVMFNFLGQQIQFAFQAGPSLGTVTIILDGLGFTLDQSDSTTKTANWVSGMLVRGTHTVVITHTGGGSVNIDAVIIPDVQTATPTSTP